jgi:CubicO group peptidase (beta-lactamase class C family)
MPPRCVLLLLLAAAFLATPMSAQKAPLLAKPESVGLSSQGLQKIHEALQQHIDKGDTPGAVVLVARKGRIAYWEAQGSLDAKTKAPLAKDTVFWVASMTKPIVATAVLIMMEAGKLSVDDPVSKFIPEFKTAAQVRVLKPGSPPPPRNPGPPDPNAPKPQYDLVPAARGITIKDILTHTSGLQSIGVPNDAIPPIVPGDTLATWVPKLAAAPLDFQPGTKWAYSNATAFEVLARIVEVTSGESFRDFVYQRIFAPLNIKNASFGPRKDLASRTMTLAPALATNQCVSGETYFCASAGLWVPADDYWRFAEMLLNEGRANGKRLLKASSVQLMAANHSDSLFAGFGGIPANGMGFGYSVELVQDHVAAGLELPNGSFGWNGVGTRQFWIIPAKEMVIIMYLPSGNAAPVHRDIEAAALHALSGTKP